MRKTCVALMWTVLALFSAGGALADVVPDLHSASVPVESQSSQAMATAAQQAMSEVLVKVSGSKEVLQNPAIAAALRDARSHVQQYAYVRGEPPAPPLSIRFEFDGGYITDLVAQSGAPLWTANRPPVLAWVVVEDEQGRHFINRESSPQEAQWLVDEFSRRGVPVQIPVFDLVDTAAVSTGDVWQMDANTIQAASARYNVQDVVAARLAVSSTGQSLGDWSYFSQDNRISRSFTVPDLQAFLRSGVNIVAGEMSARYAVAPTAGTDAGVRVAVSGVTNYADFAAVVNWLEKLELVEYANLELVQGDRIELRLQAKADAAQLASIIALNNRLTPLGLAGESGQLNYQWRN